MVFESRFVIYFFTYLIHLHPEAILFFLLFSFGIIFLYLVNNKNVVWHRTLLQKILEKHEQNTYHSRVRSKIEKYRDLSRRPKVTYILLPLLFTLALAYILLNNMLFFAVVTSGSMEPVLKKDDLVLVQNIYVEPQQGKIIMFDAEQKLPVIHRIYSITPEGIKTKGDAAENPDSWTIQKKDIKGEVVLYNNKPIIIKNIGSYFNFDPSRRKDIKYSQTFQQTAKIITKLKKMGLTIFVICILFYLFNASK